MSQSTSFFQRGIRRMTGRAPDQAHRAATPLELLFDLTFVAAFGVAGSQLAHGIAVGHVGGALFGFSFAMMAIVWAWINYSWFASAFDTDDWLFRVLTMVQMVGVVVLAIGLEPMFKSAELGKPMENEIMVAGYVVMRVALMAQWWRASRGNPKYRKVASTYMVTVGIAQAFWVATIILPLDPATFAAAALVGFFIDCGGPILAESKGAKYGGGATPWNAHHIAERYSLLAIIALGETVLGTLAAAQSITATHGWTFSSIMVIGLGVLMGFALWWVYFMVPSEPILVVRRGKAFVWGYGHILVFGSIAAVGAGLHVIGYVYDEHYHVSVFTAVASVAIPVMVLMVSLFLLHSWLVSSIGRSSLLWMLPMALPVLSMVAAAAGWPLWVCLLIVVTTPVTVVFAYELGGWRHLEAELTTVMQRAQARNGSQGD